MRVAFPLIDPRLWRGGYNYLLNLYQALAENAPGEVRPVVICGVDASAEALAPIRAVAGVEVVQDVGFDTARRAARLRAALVAGRDPVAARIFAAQRIDLAFESAEFHGWRAATPALAWMPDFQHRHLPHLFGRRAWLRRELGLRAQVAAARHVLLSSEDARADFQRFYSRDPARVSVVRFATPAPAAIVGRAGADQARAVAAAHGLPQTFFYLPNQFWAHKNHALVLEALTRLTDSRPDIVVACSGEAADPRDPAHVPRLLAKRREAGLEGRLRLLGVLPHTEVRALVRACAALINPSRFEGWSTTVEEAKASGAPLLLSDLGVHREQAQGLAHVTFFDPLSPDDLARTLAQFRPLATPERAALAEEAAVAAQARVADFAQAFVTAARRAADSRMPRRS
jgi:glycosyltransferase involved in cell wall biosynthesis